MTTIGEKKLETITYNIQVIIYNLEKYRILYKDY